jgi:anaerobic ribonucleoside-triphosphate reductase activating protein
MAEDQLFVHSILYPVLNLGPGTRIGVWVEGCSLNCPGCLSPHLFTRHAANAKPVEEVFAALRLYLHMADGVTISGGEPFEQAKPLTRLAGLIRSSGADLLVYTGYTVEEIMSGPEEMQELLCSIDMLMDGRYMQEIPNTLNWRGSDNQRLLLLSERSMKYRDVVLSKFPAKRNLQVHHTQDGAVTIVGIPQRGFQSRLRELSNKRGIFLHR